MKYTRGQFTDDYYRLWEMGLLLPYPLNASFYSVKYRKNHFDEYSRVTLKAVSVGDALERACYAITYASPWRPEDIDLHAVYDEEENLLWLDEPYYNLVQRKNEFRGMERREFLARFGATTAAILFGLRPMLAKATDTSVGFSGTASGFAPPSGEQLYTTPGSFNWSAPTKVSTVHVVCVGAAASGNNYGAAGGGGGLGYKNNIAITGGQSYSVQVGDIPNVNATAGQDSFFINGTTVKGGGGGAPTSGTGAGTGGAGGSFVGDGGGNGGRGGNGVAWSAPNPYPTGGGGGAGGYSGSGGNGANASLSASQSGSSGSGGGGGGGASGYHSADGIGASNGGGGGGVGLYGAGASGGGGLGGQNPTSDYPLLGGRGGSSGGDGKSAFAQSWGGNYGGAKSNGYADNGYATRTGGGAVRIMWGAGRSFPSNAS